MADDAHNRAREDVLQLQALLDELQAREGQLAQQIADAHEVGEQLWQDNQMLRALLHGMFDGFITLDPDWHIRAAHIPVAGSIPGAVTDAESIGRKLFDVFPEVVGTLADRELHRARSEGTLVEFEQYYQPWRRWFVVRAYPFRDYLHVCYQDITERKQAEEALRRSEERFRLVWAKCADGLRLTNEQGIVVLVNDAYCRLVELPRDVVEGRPLALAYAENRRDYILATYQENWRSGTVQPHYEQQLNLWNGKQVWFEGTNSFLESDGQAPLLLGIFRDISDRKRTEEALRQSEERFRTLFDQSPRAVNIARRGTVLQLNQASLQLFDYQEPAELIGASVLKLVAPECRPAIEERTRLREEGKAVPNRYETVGMRKNGASFPLLVEVARIDLPDGPASVAFLTDLTEQHRVEEQRLVLERRLADAKKWESLAALAGGVAHDFNNLLSVILGHAGLARMDLPADSPARPALDGIEVAARRAARLTNQMLAYAGKGRLDTAPVDLNQAVTDAMAMLAGMLSPTTTLRTDLAPDLPIVAADPDQMRQVIYDLLANAAEAIGPEQAGVIAITTRRDVLDRARLLQTVLGGELAEGEYVLVQVADNGCGMDPATQARIFEPFFSTKFTGRGLGLAAVLGIIRGHRGTLRVTSAPGEGTTCQVWIPVPRG